MKTVHIYEFQHGMQWVIWPQPSAGNEEIEGIA